MTISANFSSIRPSLNFDFSKSKILDPRITMTRASTAAYYDGKTFTLAEQNLVSNSQGFTSWTGVGCIVTGTYSAPDGTTSAYLLTQNTASSYHGVNSPSVTGANPGTYTLSVYAKANTSSWLALNMYDSTDRTAYFDLTNGVLGSVATGGTATITSATNGWYRCAFTRTQTVGPNTSGAIIAVTSANNVWNMAGDGVSSIYIWGAQLENRGQVTAYTATGSTGTNNFIPVLQYATNNQPRFDHEPTTGTSLGLLIEEQRTNYLLYSLILTGNLSNLTGIQNCNIAPDGTLTAMKFIPGTAAGGSIYWLNSGGPNTATTYTYSMHAKAAEYSQFALTFAGGGFSPSGLTYFNVATGTLTTTTSSLNASITPVGNGWYRCSISGTTLASGSVDNSIYLTFQDSTGTNYSCNGFGGIYFWGRQTEAGHYPTSYIPTSNGQATRIADSLTMTGARNLTWLDNFQGSFYSEMSLRGGPTYGSFGTSPVLIGTDYAANGGYFLLYYDNVGTAFQGRFAMSAANNFYTYSTTTNFTSYRKIATTYSTTNVASIIDNGTIGIGSTPIGILPKPTFVNIGMNPYSNGNYLNGWIKKLAYYPQALSSTQLQTLTSS